MARTNPDKKYQYQKVMPEDMDMKLLNIGDWNPRTSEIMRTRILTAARIMVLDNNWDTVAKRLGYQDGTTAQEEIRKRHKQDWAVAYKLAMEAIQDSVLPQMQVQVLKKAMKAYIDCDDDSKNYERIARIAVEAASRTSTYLSNLQKNRGDAGDEPGELSKEMREANEKFLQDFKLDVGQEDTG